MKYIKKNATSNTVWKKILASSSSRESAGNVDKLTKSESSSLSEKKMKLLVTPAPSVYLALLTGTENKFKIKLLTWSRNFDFTPFYIQHGPLDLI